MRTLIHTAALLMSLSFNVCFSEIADAQVSSEQKRQLDQVTLQDVPDGAPGIATGIVVDGKIIYSKCVGFANLESESQINSRSRFNIASNGKQFTALAILKLEAEGKLSLTDDIRKYFPDFYPKIKSPITIEQLITHTSGIRSIHHLWSLQGKTWWKFEFGNDDVMELLKRQEDLSFTPGTDHLYSNSNYVLMAEIVAKVSGRSFVDYTNEMFRQLGMPDTSFESDHTAIRGSIAKPYFNFQTWKGYDWLADIVGDGCLFSTLDDQLQWECIVQGAGETKFDRALIQRSQRLVNAELCSTYGFGLEHRDEGGRDAVFHAGSTGAWKAYSLRYPEQKLAVVTLTNSGRVIPSMHARQVSNIIMGKSESGETSLVQSKPETVGPKVETDEILGTYLAGGFFFEFIQSKGELYLRRDGRSDVRLERESANVFHEVDDPKFKQEFVRNEDGELQVTAYHNTHAPYSLTRVSCDWNGHDYESIDGTYVNSETDGEIRIEHQEGKQYSFTIKGKKTRNAKLVTPNRLASGSYVIEWSEEHDEVPGFMLYTNAVRRVKFTRLTADSLSPDPQDLSVRDENARSVMARRISDQQQFLFEFKKSNPPEGNSTEARIRWMDSAEQAFKESLQNGSSDEAESSTRYESFSPYVWSWMPMLVTEGSPGEELINRTRIIRVLPTLLADLETVVEQREPGACELLRVPDLGNGLSRVQLLVQVDQSFLKRFREAVDKLPAVVSAWQVSFQKNGVKFPRHLRSALPQMQQFAKLIDIELALREDRLEEAQARVSSMATPGMLPSGFRSFVERLARQYHGSNQTGAALAVLDMGLLSTTEGDWPSASFRSLYEECGGRTATQRFELAVARRAAPLVRSSIKFDLGTLVDIETGKALDSDAFEGKTVVLDFMTRGCAPCLEAVPKLQAFDEDRPDVVVLTVVVGESKDRPVVMEAVRERGGKFTMVYDTANWMEKLNVYGYPSYIVVSPDKTVLKPFGLRVEATHSFDEVVATLDLKE